ncbi:MAG: signal peptidase I [Bryobacteraceae bacterium]
MPSKETTRPAPRRGVPAYVFVGAAAFLLGFVGSLLCSFVVVVSPSMADSFCTGEKLFIGRATNTWGPLSLHPGPLRRGTVVVFRAPWRTPLPDLQIKRIVAVGGDSVRITKGRLFLNGRWLQEGYVRHGARYSSVIDFWPRPGPDGAQDSVDVPPGSVVVLGDNRDVSSDTRDWGFLPEANIVGQVLFRASTSSRNAQGKCLSD